MYVEEVNIDRSRYIDDKDYWRNMKDYELGLKHNRYVCLRLIANAPEGSKLTLQHLRDKGLAGRIQSPRKKIILLYTNRNTTRNTRKNSENMLE